MNVSDCLCHGLRGLTKWVVAVLLLHGDPPCSLHASAPTAAHQALPTFLTWVVTGLSMTQISATTCYCRQWHTQRRDLWEAFVELVCSSSGTACQNHSRCFTTASGCIVSQSQTIRHADTVKLNGVGFLAKSVSAQSSSVSLAEFTHTSKARPLKQPCPTYGDHCLE